MQEKTKKYHHGHSLREKSMKRKLHTMIDNLSPFHYIINFYNLYIILIVKIILEIF